MLRAQDIVALRAAVAWGVLVDILDNNNMGSLRCEGVLLMRTTQREVALLTCLLLDLVSCPAGCVLRSLSEVLVGTSLAGHLRKPIVSEELADLSSGECFRNVTASLVSILVSRMCVHKLTQ